MVGIPTPTPSTSLSPIKDSLVLFRVDPGVSYHAVGMVKKGQRMSISGWIHGESSEDGGSSLGGILAFQEAFVDLPKPADEVYTDTDLHKFINPSYLSPTVQEHLKGKFLDDGFLLLDDFLHPDMKRQFIEAEYELDQWKCVGPPSLKRYMTPRGVETGVIPEVKKRKFTPNLHTLLRNLHEFLLTRPFLDLLTSLTTLTPTSHRGHPRLFRPDKDYTLALPSPPLLHVNVSMSTDGNEVVFVEGGEGEADVYGEGEAILVVGDGIGRCFVVLREVGVCAFVKVGAGRVDVDLEFEV